MTATRGWRRTGGAAAAVLVAAVLAVATLVGSPRVQAAGTTGVSGTPAQLLGRLSVAAERPGGYARSLFVHWVDADRDGCDTRREVLIGESRTAVTVGTRCRLSGGRWWSAYDGAQTTDPSTFDIDHVVPLKEAWDSGAWAWDPVRRRAYANDLGDYRALRAVSASSNRAKSDRDPAQWLPPRAGFRCQYASEWIAVKVRWRLRIDAAEKAALAAIVRGCPATRLSVAVLAAAATGSGAGGSSGSGGATATAPPGCDPNYGGACVPISTTDLDCGDVRQRVTVIGTDIHRLDGDGDGVGCESYP